MRRNAALITLVAGSTAFDFWRGYRHAGDALGGVVYVILGFGVLGLLIVVLRPQPK